MTVECPHCESEFHLNPDLAGKTIPCPSCRLPFTVTAAAALVPPADLPYERVEAAMTDLPAAEVPTDRSRPAPPVALPLPPRTVPTAAPLPSAIPLPAPAEVAWSDDLAPPPGTRSRPAGATRTQPQTQGANAPRSPGNDPDDGEEFIRRRPRRRSWAGPVAAVLAAAIVLVGGGSGVGLWRHAVLKEQRAVEAAKLAYADAKFEEARTQYQALLSEFPDSPAAGEYRFFVALAGLQMTAGGTTVRDDPAPARRAFDQFVADFGADPLARPGAGFGSDVLSAGKRVAEATADHAQDHLKLFQADRKKLPELATAEEASAAGKALLPVAAKYRDATSVDLDSVAKRFADLDATAAGERHRLAVLEPWRTLPDDPTAPKIEAFEAVLVAEKLSADAEARGIVTTAEEALRKIDRYTAVNLLPAPCPPDPAPPVLFTAPLALANGEAFLPLPADPDPAAGPVVFALDRGVLYALDARTGSPLWGTRIAAPTADRRAADLPVPVTVGESAAVLVAGEVAGRPGVCARAARTGDPVWYQPLAAPPAGRPLVVGGRVYLPLADEAGTIAEFDTASGTRLGDLALRQPIGAGLAAVPTGRPGGHLLIAPADNRRVLVFELGREADDGRRLPPRLVRVMQTGHPRDSLRGEPVAVTPAADAGPRFLVLTQADGTTKMKLRSFPLPTADVILGAADIPAASADPAAEAAVDGWAWSPAVTDGERLVLATDANAFIAMGVNQPGSADAPLFVLPGPKPAADQESVARAQVVAAGEDEYWVVLGGQLLKLRTAVDPAGGLRVVPQGGGRAVGEPQHRPQVVPALNLAVVVTRTAGGVQAVGVDLGTGRVRWQRRVGVVPTGPPVPVGDAVVVAGVDGSIYRVTAAAVESLAPPDPAPAGPATVAVDPAGPAACVVTTDATPAGRRARLRFVANGAVREVVLPLPDAVAGVPILSGQTLLIPLANGNVYRATPADTQFHVGPLWRGEAGTPESVCHLGPAGPDEFFATDGGKRFLRWKWPEGGKPTPAGGPWELPAAVALPPVAVGPDRVAAADERGVVSLFAGPKLARRWPNPAAGAPTGRLALVATADKTVIVACLANRHLVGFDPDKPAPAWLERDLGPADVGELAGWAVAGDAVTATDPVGRVRSFDAFTGNEREGTPPAAGAGPPTTAAVPVGAGLLFAVTADGTGVRMGR